MTTTTNITALSSNLTAAIAIRAAGLWALVNRGDVYACDLYFVEATIASIVNHCGGDFARICDQANHQAFSLDWSEGRKGAAKLLEQLAWWAHCVDEGQTWAVNALERQVTGRESNPWTMPLAS